MNKTAYFAETFLWGLVSKLFDAIVKFLTIPMLMLYLGKEQYGILTLAIATNAYMFLLDLGLNTGAIKYFSQWMEIKNSQLVEKVARTGLTFYLFIGLVNAFILLFIAYAGENWFEVTHEQFQQLRWLLIIMSCFSLINWATSIFSQLLMAFEQMRLIQQISLFKTIAQLFLILYSIYIHLSLINYFSFYLTINALEIIPYLFYLKKKKIITSILPAFHWISFKPVVIYSLSIFAMGLFQFTAMQSRPIILAIYSPSGIQILSEYRIIEVFPLFVISIGGLITTILLPQTSRIVLLKNQSEIERMAYQGTALTSVIVSVLIFPIITISQEIMELYMGKQYVYLAGWLNLWLITLLLYLYNSPISSLVLATGKTKMLVYSSAIACIISIIINAILCPLYGVGSAVIGYLVYVIIQMLFYYTYFNTNVLHVNSYKVFKSFILPVSIGTMIMLPILFIKIESISTLWIAIIKASVWGLGFGITILISNIGSVRTEIMRFYLNRIVTK